MIYFILMFISFSAVAQDGACDRLGVQPTISEKYSSAEMQRLRILVGRWVVQNSDCNITKKGWGKGRRIRSTLIQADGSSSNSIQLLADAVGYIDGYDVRAFSDHPPFDMSAEPTPRIIARYWKDNRLTVVGYNPVGFAQKKYDADILSCVELEWDAKKLSIVVESRPWDLDEHPDHGHCELKR